MHTVKERTKQTVNQLKNKNVKPTLKKVIQYSIFNPNGSLIGNEKEVKEILQQSEPDPKNDRDFLRLKKLCQAVNKRIQADKNDDDEIFKLFSIAPKLKNAYIFIGWNSYEAITEDQKTIYLSKVTEEPKENERAFYYSVNDGKLIIFK